MITCFLTHVGKEHLTFRADDEGAALLERIALSGTLTMALPEGPQGMLARPQVKHGRGATFQPGGPIGLQCGIDQHRVWHLSLVPERGGLPGLAATDDHELSAQVVNGILDVAQLCDFLTAEQSPKVSDEHQANGAIPPQVAKADRLVIRIGQLDISQSMRWIHDTLQKLDQDR